MVVPSGGGITVNTTTITGGTNTQIPFNDGGVYSEDSALTWDKTNNALTVNSNRLFSQGTDGLFLGNSAGNFTLTGVANTGIGTQALVNVTSGEYNVALGAYALSGVQGGSRNIGIGHITGSGTAPHAANNNVFIGHEAGDNIGTGGDGNILIGYLAANSLTTGAANIVIGNDIEAQSNTTSNQLSIQNVIFGAGNSGAGVTVSSGNLGLYATSWGTSAAKVIALGDGTAPTTSPADMIQYYSESGVMKYRDEANNIITI
jgi:hypothetical protein